MITVKIKRGTGKPSSLEYGEPAVNTAGTLYIGDSNSSPIKIGGNRSTATIAATSPNTTTTIDSFLLSEISTAKWLIDIRDDTAGTFSSFELHTANDGTASPPSSTSTPLGSFTDYTANVVGVNSPIDTIELQVTNAGVNTIKVNATRIDVNV